MSAVTERQDLARHYEAQTDDELLQLREESGQLIPEAREALYNELSKRKISAESGEGLPEVKKMHEPTNSSQKISFLFPSLGRFVATLRDWKRFKSETGRWPVLTIAAHVVHGIFLVGWAGLLIWLGITYKWSGIKVSLIILPLLLIDTILENWVEGRIRRSELQRYRRKRTERSQERGVKL